ncbi:MAG TPA: protein kinase [Pyrinomonadaceae bacterium]|jgi:GAF domain-containing protein
MSQRTRFILVCLFFAFAYVYAGLNAYQSFAAQDSSPGWQTRQPGRRVEIRSVHEGSPAAEVLRRGDEIVSINEQPVGSVRQARALTTRLAVGASYRIVVRRDGVEQGFTLRTGPVPLRAWLTLFAISVFLPVIFLSTGFAVFLLKPDDKQALLFALMFGLMIIPTAFGQTAGLPAPLAAVMLAGPAMSVWFFPLFLHFFLVFPDRSPLLRRFPRAELYLYVPHLLFALPDRVLDVMLAAGANGASFDSPAASLLQYAGVAVTPLYLLGGLVSLVSNYRRADLLARRRMRVVVAGMLAGMLPGTLLFFVIPVAALFAGVKGVVGEGFEIFAYLGFALVPLSFAYAILRHRVIPVSLIIRRSVQYLLAKNALRVLLLLPVAGLVVSIAADPNRKLSDILLRNSFYFYLLLAAAVALGLVFRRRLSEWIDRKFFREQYDQEKILRALVDDVKRLDSMPEMSRRVSEEVERALHPERAYLFYRERDHGDLSLSYTSGGTSHDLRIPDSFQLLRLMELQGGAQDFPLPPKTNLPQGEKDWLASLGARLVVPMTGTDNRLAGLFILGDKKSEVPYTARDRELLESVAGQIAIVYENLRLKGRVREDRKVRREVLSRFEGQQINLLKECPRCGRCFDSAATECERDGAELTLTLPVERVVEGRYRLERLIGKGGMGAVYEATHLKLNHRVALKVLSGQMFGNASALRRFEREAQALARLSQHPNIVSVHDYGELQTEGAFLVMDLIEGESLGALLKRERRLDAARAADIFHQVLEGLKAAHAAGVVHRDLKPDNVFLSRTPEGRAHVRLLDFGLAKLTQGLAADSEAPTAREPFTTPGAVMGTFGYMPPEQLTGGRVDERSDLFPVGVMIVEALTGERPFKGKTLHELLTDILHGEYHLPGGGAGAGRLDGALQLCLAKEPAARFASAAEAQAQLIPALREYSPHDSPADAETVILRQP